MGTVAWWSELLSAQFRNILFLVLRVILTSRANDKFNAVLQRHRGRQNQLTQPFQGPKTKAIKHKAIGKVETKSQQVQL